MVFLLSPAEFFCGPVCFWVTRSNHSQKTNEHVCPFGSHVGFAQAMPGLPFCGRRATRDSAGARAGLRGLHEDGAQDPGGGPLEDPIRAAGRKMGGLGGLGGAVGGRGWVGGGLSFSGFD